MWFCELNSGQILKNQALQLTKKSRKFIQHKVVIGRTKLFITSMSRGIQCLKASEKYSTLF